MNIHYLQHVPFERLGTIESWAENYKHLVSRTQLFNENFEFPDVSEIDFLIIMGGPMTSYEEEKFPWLQKEKAFIKEAILKNKKVLGICLGAQLIADALGAKVFPGEHKEIGWFPVYKSSEEPERSKLLDVFPQKFSAFHWHGDVFNIPMGAVHLAGTSACENQAFVYNEKVLALQFHLETTPQSAEELIRHCGDEITDAQFIQKPDEILSNYQAFEKSNKLMETILELFNVQH